MTLTVNGHEAEIGAPAQVWRFDTEKDAYEYAVFLSGHWDNTKTVESWNRDHGHSWLTFAWNAP